MTSTPAEPGPGARIAARYERHFVPAIGRPFARRLVELAGLARGERVLDVGCGTGVVARLAARRVGADGAVTGVDVNPDMLAEARVTDDADGIEWRQADAQSLPFPEASFDVVLCQLSLMFVDDRARALGEMRRVLVDGGRLLLNVPGPATPPFEDLAAALESHVGAAAAGFLRRVFSIDDDDELRRLLGQAGFREVTVSTGEQRLELPAPAEFLEQYIASTPLAIEVGRADAEARAALESQVLESWRTHAGDGALAIEQPYLVARARR